MSWRRHRSTISHRTAAALSLFAGFATAAPAARVLAQVELPYPRLANIYLLGSVDPADIPKLARWDLLILNSSWSDAELRQIRTLNPDIKMFAYVCPYCVEVPPNPGDSWKIQNYNYVQSNNLWWYNRNQFIASDWPGTQLINVTDLAPTGPSGHWRDYLAGRVSTLLQTRPMLDGVYYDNYWRTLSWEQGAIQVDSDCNPTHSPAGCNGVMDTNATVDTLWNRALHDLAAKTRTQLDRVQSLRPDHKLAILGDRVGDYFSSMNGSVYEFFPAGWTAPDPGNAYGYNWNQEMFGVPEGYTTAPFSADPYRVQIINADWTGSTAGPDRTADFERHKRFTFASTLLGDGYYSLDAASSGHDSFWWEPEFDNGGRERGYLGYPQGPMYRVTVPTGPEIVLNGSFSQGTASWATLPVNATGTFSIDNSVFKSGTSSAKVSVASVQSGGSYKLYQSAVWVTGGQGYTLTFWARSASPQNIVVELYSPSCPGFSCLGARTYNLTTTWTKFETPFVASGTAGSGLNIYFTDPGTVWIDDMSLRLGDSSVYRRDFTRGTVILNYTTTTQNVALGRTYYHMDIPGSPLYDGAAVTSETLAPSDARILVDNPHPSTTPPPPPGGPAYVLHQNEPNPFNPQTVIRFTTARDERVALGIYDVAGRLVKKLVDRRLAAGDHSVQWNGADRLGRPVPSGVYYYRIETPSFHSTRKMTLLQ